MHGVHDLRNSVLFQELFTYFSNAVAVEVVWYVSYLDEPLSHKLPDYIAPRQRRVIFDRTNREECGYRVPSHLTFVIED